VLPIDGCNGDFSGTIKIIRNLQLKLGEKKRVVNRKTEWELNP